MADLHKNSPRHRYVELMSGRGGGLGPATLRTAASAASVVYSLAISARNAAYDGGLLPVRRLPRPVVSVGNLSAGGTGKTVLVAEIACWVRDAGKRPAVLLRGYTHSRGRGRPGSPDKPGSPDEDDSPPKSDEASMLRELLGDGIAVEPDPDRLAAGRRLLAGGDPPDMFILDDGFQHRRLARDINIVTIDATMDLDGPLARVLPRGLLREPVSSLARADFVVLTRVDQADPAAIERILKSIASASPRAAALRTRHAASGLVQLVEQADARACGPAAKHLAATPQACVSDVDMDVLANRRFLAFAGIGNPAAFHRTARELPGECVGFVAFDDHHAYSENDIAELVRRARAEHADALVTTRKDLVKLDPAWTDIAIYAVNVELAWIDDFGLLKNSVLALFSRDTKPPKAAQGSVF